MHKFALCFISIKLKKIIVKIIDHYFQITLSMIMYYLLFLCAPVLSAAAAALPTYLLGGYMYVESDGYCGGSYPEGLFTNTNVVFLSLLDPSNLTFPASFASIVGHAEVQKQLKMVTIGGYVSTVYLARDPRIHSNLRIVNAYRRLNE